MRARAEGGGTTITRMAAAALAVLLWAAAVPAAAAPAGPAPAAGDPPVLIHRARVQLQPDLHRLSVVDTLTAPAGVAAVALHKGLRLPAGLPADTSGAHAVVRLADLPALPAAAAAAPGDPFAPPPGARTVLLTYEGEFHEPTAGLVFSRENVGREVQLTVSDEGCYLAAAARWLPAVEGALARHRLTIVSPAGVEPVTEGMRRRHEASGDGLLTVWSAPHPSDGLTLVAAPYVVTEERHGDISISVWLLREDARLAATYLERTRVYLDLYAEMIGPYPYGKFATVENWFPTGYGMPSYTLLGGQVMRLPFIPYTSFGHEICHNWWGNSVFVAEEGGNWCEGLTSWCADYHYKEQESADAAREYRRNLLKDYAAYVREGNDEPLSAFRARHSGATRAIGYGKSLMVFHMVERMIGREAFLTALRDVYARRLFQRASWDDFFAAFAAASGRDLAAFQAQWLDRPGAPRLALREARADGERVIVELEQQTGGQPPYLLEVPLVVAAAGGGREHVVKLEGERGRFELVAPGALSVAVDPDWHLFRRLDPAEIEPTLSMVLGVDAPPVVLPAGDEAEIAAARAFAVAFTEQDEPTLFAGGLPPADLPATALTSLVLINPPPAELTPRLPPALAVAGDLVFLNGQRHSLKEHDLVFAAANPRRPDIADLVVLCRSPDRLPGLAGRIGHYGKYSYLLLPAGRGEVIRGNWPLAAGPLTARLR